jgi:hypothetical protein
MGAVMTTINRPAEKIKELFQSASSSLSPFVVIGDAKSKFDWSVIGADYYSLESQKKLDFHSIKTTKENHYARKNIGYLILFEKKCEWIYETDDDNLPIISPFLPRSLTFEATEYSSNSQDEDGRWVNIYDIFLESQNVTHPIWPRGFNLIDINKKFQHNQRKIDGVFSIQQGLANLDPDVDAIYRLLFKNEILFDEIEPVTIGDANWAPINSQSTWWHQQVQRLMYLPATCSFRLTDILRGYVALRIMKSIGHKISFHSPIVYQVRNEHNLIEDFAGEIKLYTQSQLIERALDELILDGLNLTEKLRSCYEALVAIEVVEEGEINILESWCLDCDSLSVAK